MITLNLISPLQKKELKLLRMFIILKSVIYTLVLFIIFVAMVLLLAQMILQNNFNRTINEYNLITRSGQLFGQEIKQFNQELKSIQSIQADFTPWSEFIISIVNLTPDEIVLYSFTIDRTTRDFQIRGRAKNRQSLLDYQKNLKETECSKAVCLECKCFKEVEIPLSTLLEKENIDFKILTKLNTK